MSDFLFVRFAHKLADSLNSRNVPVYTNPFAFRMVLNGGSAKWVVVIAN